MRNRLYGLLFVARPGGGAPSLIGLPHYRPPSNGTLAHQPRAMAEGKPEVIRKPSPLDKPQVKRTYRCRQTVLQTYRSDQHIVPKLVGLAYPQVFTQLGVARASQAEVTDSEGLHVVTRLRR